MGLEVVAEAAEELVVGVEVVGLLVELPELKLVVDLAEELVEGVEVVGLVVELA